MKKLTTKQDDNSSFPESGELLNKIKAKLPFTGTLNKTNPNIHNILHTMGYSNTQKGLDTLEQFLSSCTIYDWLRSGHYDFRYNSKEFLKKLSSVLNINPDLYIHAINHYDILKNEYNKIKGCYIFVNTNFHRTSQPIFSLAFMENHRRLRPKKQELMFKTNKKVFEHISKRIKKHYQKTHGKLPMWGKIDNYHYHHFDGNTYIFDNNGCLLDSSHTISESRAILSIK